MTTSIHEKEVVAAFDFDGTITQHDTLLSFLMFTAGKWTATKKLAYLSPQVIGFLLKLVSRQEVKEAVLEHFFKGMPSDQLLEMGTAFANSRELSQLIHPEAMMRLVWHQRQHHRCILVSASIDTYLAPWCNKYGFNDLICSKLQIDQYNHVTGLLDGLNCWGPEKERRLLKLLGPRENFILYAYGDSCGDQELLSIADYPFYRKMPSSSF